MEAPKKVWDKNNQWTAELEVLKSIINRTQLVETTKWGGIVYTSNGKNVLGIGGFKNFFTIWFFKGVFLKDEAGVLVNANEGNTKSLRQLRFANINEVDEKLVLNYINEAIEVEKAGLGIKPQKKETIVPEYLQQQLDEDSILAEAFAAFSPYKQKEFCEYIAEAKQDKTKLARFEKVKPMILEGKGLNDRYR
ncbi:hypothetical protein FMM05_03490 [Flavobacterium zepuense]|uniref:YdhG-like domain-containing protein n=1 Tax=Flavobacterium zepuense TaxID=2593302 RepID=A0A552V7L2_9FLAO|nr:YdeI/OmpD-associated family protein [Flavobacterium zepuense]TRW26456.1 hypothetical protein FMM05_03490 [Flavobacterium zepuense]